MTNTAQNLIKIVADNEENMEGKESVTRIKQEGRTVFIRNEDNVYLGTFNPDEKRIYQLEAGFYNLEWDGVREIFYLRVMELQGMPKKIYGDVKMRSQRILNTFNDRGSNTGVLLHGMKGTGKSLLSRQVSLDAVEQGKPVIFIAAPYAGPKFTEFMEDIKQPCVINIDEFEKTYGGREDGKAQEGLLSMMDGISKQNKLWLLTVNETNRVNQYMMNRPNRLFYKFEYGVIPVEVVEEICADKGFTTEQTENLVSIYSLIKELTFDVLMAIIEESKRYNEMPQTCIRFLNIDIESNSNMYYPDIKVFKDGELVLSTTVHAFSPDHPVIELSGSSKPERELFQSLMYFRKDYLDDFTEFKEENEDGEFESNDYEYCTFELKQTHFNGKKGIREYEFNPDEMNDVGCDKQEGVKLPRYKIVLLPKKSGSKDQFSDVSSKSSANWM